MTSLGEPNPEVVDWLLSSDEPWTRYRTLRDLLALPEHHPRAMTARAEMLAHPQVHTLVSEAVTWGQRPLKRHNDASHPLYKFSTLADLGLHARQDGPVGDALQIAIETVLSHQSAEGAFQTVVNIPRRFGGKDQDEWSWMACDAPTLLYSLLRMGLMDDPRVQRAVEHLVGKVQDNGWRCSAAQELGRFRGPGRKDDPCPVANVYALKALAQISELRESPAARNGVEMLLAHWQHQGERKLYLFGIGTDFRKLKYPFVWYDVLHVADVLSQFTFARNDSRLQEMVSAVVDQADEQGRYTATSMYRAWKGWSFADKRNPSPWLTFLVLRMLGRME